MRVVKDWDESAELWSFVGTGDGTDEFHILRAVAEKYNGTCSLWFPKSPLGKKTGLAVLDSIKTVIDKTSPQINTFLFLIDREHIVQRNRRSRDELDNSDIKVMIEHKLSNEHIRIIKIDDTTPDGAFIINGKLGSRVLQICVIIQGINLKIEEEISKLIKLEKDITIPTEKENIQDFFKETFHRKSIGQGTAKLIAGANKNNLRMSFPGLTFILNAIEKQCSENN
ncbi:MAG: hypothetical protein C4B59_01575 [Candidatus Methanogaster sp.]|uniref:Uncharacterized protein n=1 Tax=Candidatus Methanogaster sp. TaxID=3386292 RepID=A0AC61L6K2_9EURY|nr:MAG: hypothetical protein C4B59_01575 [ANME-2 cluster archaeon]